MCFAMEAAVMAGRSILYLAEPPEYTCNYSVVDGGCSK